MDVVQNSNKILEQAKKDKVFQQEVIVPLMGIVFIGNSSKESIMGAITLAYFLGKEAAIKEAADYKPDGEDEE